MRRKKFRRRFLGGRRRKRIRNYHISRGGIRL
uniref:Uncharacterized protein n=1 Tax=Dulem virus 86 TaxID=3145797 RepID=A0AAU8B977_9VIRU